MSNSVFNIFNYKNSTKYKTSSEANNYRYTLQSLFFMQNLGSLLCTSLPSTGAVQTVSHHFFNTFIKWYRPFLAYKVSWKEFRMYFLCDIYAACYINSPFRDRCFHYSHNFRWKLPIMKLLTTQCSAVLCCFHPVTSKYPIHQLSRNSAAWDMFYNHTK
jgi:hypothetical protein